MDNNINSFGEEFEKEMLECVEDEKEFAKILRRHKDLYEKRTKLIIECRDKKIEEINNEIKKCTLELKEIAKSINRIKKSNCCIGKEHKYVLLSSQCDETDPCLRSKFPPTRYGCFTNTYKCVYCGKEKIEYEEGYLHYIKSFVMESPKTSDECSSKRVAELVFSNEIQNAYKRYCFLVNYIDYLKWLIPEVCEIFGHDVNAKIDKFSDPYNPDFICKRCGKEMSEREYNINHDNRMFNYNLYPFGNGYTDFIIKNRKELKLSLPTFEMYQSYMKEKEKFELAAEQDRKNYYETTIKPLNECLSKERYCKARIYSRDKSEWPRSPQTIDEYKESVKRIEEASKKWWL